jgi:nucleotidyltransferase substrate binding protein (TIGR01987 family)
MDETVLKKIDQLDDALQDFRKSLNIDLSLIKDEILLDTVKSGQIQKFEMVLEILWKTLKKYLLEINGIDPISPKTVIKSWFETGYCGYEEYESLIDLINKRNKLSHMYKRDEYLEIHKGLSKAYMVMQAQMEVLRS